MRKSVIVIHGSFGNIKENWIPWLESQCKNKDISFKAISFPTPVGQTYDNWSEIFKSYVEKGVVNENSIVVAHSSGASFFAKYATLNKLKVKKFISVAGFTDFLSGNNDFDKINTEFYLEENKNFDLSSISEIISFYSKNDPYLPLEVLSDFSKKIKAKENIIKEAGHFNTDSGYDKFELLLKEILSE